MSLWKRIAQLTAAAGLMIWLPASVSASTAAAAPASPVPGILSDKAYAAQLAESRHLFAALLAHPSADTLAAAASFARLAVQPPDPADDHQALSLIDQAVALAPSRPELVWLQLAACRRGDCDPAPIEERLKTLDPENGLLWLSELGRRYRAGDESATTALVADMGTRPRFSFYTNQLVVMLYDAFGVADPAMSAERRAVNAWGVVAAWAIPPLQPLSKTCGADALPLPGRRDACQTLMRKLETSDANIVESIALGIQQRWWSADSPEAVALREQRRLLHYLIASAGRERPFRQDHDARVRMEATRRHPREKDADYAVLKAFGRPTEPPRDWRDPMY